MPTTSLPAIGCPSCPREFSGLKRPCRNALWSSQVSAAVWDVSNKGVGVGTRGPVSTAVLWWNNTSPYPYDLLTEALKWTGN